jgi:predicted ATPase
MIRTIHLERFKCFEQLDLELAPFTLLTGYNGAGKSSAIQPLLLISQAMRAREAAVLSLNGRLVRLGSVAEIMSAGGERTITLGFADELGNSARWSLEQDRALGGQEMRLTEARFSFEDGTVPRWRASTEQPLLQAIRDVIFLSATRQPQQEAQPYPDFPATVVGDVGVEGEFAAYWYVRQADEEVAEARRHPNETRITVRGQIDAWLADLFPGANVNAESVTGVSLAKTTFRLGRSPDWRRPSNVGYGLSYVFPLLVALVCAKPSQIIVVDSPEAHLHPSAQSTMGSILAHFAAAGAQLVVESHSDHLLSGLRLAVRRGNLAPDAALVHFFESATGDECPTKIGIDEDGGIQNWPTGFFDQAISDLVKLS